MFSFESAWHRTEKDKKNTKKQKKKKKKKKRVYCNSQKKVGIFLFSNFNRLFSPDYASAAQVLYL